jgi:hypothetical protein
MVARTAVVAGTATAVSGRVSRRQQNRFAQQQQEQAPPPEAAAPEAPTPTADDDVTELEQIADLHQRGVLTDEEFAAKKAQILGI